MLVGIVAGLLAFGFARIFGESQVDRAIAFEDQMDRVKGEAPGPEIVSPSAAAFIGIIVITQLLLPDINEVPDQFPAVVLWRFRIVSLGIQVILWSTFGLLFGAVAERVLSKQYKFAKPAVH